MRDALSNPIDLVIVDPSFENIDQIYYEIYGTLSKVSFFVLFRVFGGNTRQKLIEKGIPQSSLIYFDTYDLNLLSSIFTQIITDKINLYANLNLRVKDHYFSGALDDISIFDLLYSVERTSKTGILKITEKNNVYCEIFFEEGMIKNAFGSYRTLDLKDNHMLEKLLSVDLFNSEYEFLSDINSTDKTMNLSISFFINEHFRSKNKFDVSNAKNYSIRDTLVTRNDFLSNVGNVTNIRTSNGNLEKKKMETLTNFDNVIEIAEDTYWVSYRNPKSLLQLNTYLRVFKGNGRAVNLLVDPGALEYFPTVSAKVGKVAGDISKIHMYSINHQDPDVGMNSVFISRINNRSVCLCTEDTWRLVQFYEIPKNAFKDVYSFENKSINIATDASHTIEFVPTPYCHFVGAFALYDKRNRTLFTGDLFAGLTPINNLSLVATEEHWEGIKTFHQIYMPSNKALRNAIDNIRKLDPPPLTIVPQHGSILAGDIMEIFMNRLYNLDVGVELLNKDDYAKVTPVYIELMNTIYNRFVTLYGVENTVDLFKFNDKKQEFFYTVDMDNNGVKSVYSNPERAFNLLLQMISKCNNSMIVNEIKSLAVKEALLMRLPIPSNLYDMSSYSQEDPAFSDSSSEEASDIFS